MRQSCAWPLLFLAFCNAEEFHAPDIHRAPSPASSPAAAPANRNHLVDLSPITPKQTVLSFSNPFRQYEGGSIPGWHYGGDATLFNDYLSLSPASPNRVGWVWSTEAQEMPAWEVCAAGVNSCMTQDAAKQL